MSSFMQGNFNPLDNTSTDGRFLVGRIQVVKTHYNYYMPYMPSFIKIILF